MKKILEFKKKCIYTYIFFVFLNTLELKIYKNKSFRMKPTQEQGKKNMRKIMKHVVKKKKQEK